MPRILLCLMASVCSCAAMAQKPTATSMDIPQAPLSIVNPLQDKSFYLLSLLERSPKVRAALLRDPALSKLAAGMYVAERNAASLPDQSATFYNEPFLWSDAQIKSVSDALRILYRTDSNIRALVQGQLRRSGAYETLQSNTDEELLIKAWLESAEGMNNILSIYGMGRPPRYPEIDSVSYDVRSESYREVLNDIAWTVNTEHDAHSLFFDPSLHFALSLLVINRRDEAARYEPMQTGENAKAFKYIPLINWSHYPYSVIVVPGIGPELRDVPLSPMGRMHVVAAAKRYREGDAPLILLSGGFVHPEQTHYSEAIEMKRALMRDFGVPEQAILIDPHARHTTTNLRNAAREIYRYGLPFTKPALITSDLYQSRYIESIGFMNRCNRELGYVPFLSLRRISPIDLEWLPNIESLQQNAMAPLDP